MVELSPSNNGHPSLDFRRGILFGYFSFIIGLISLVVHCILQIFTAGLYLMNDEARFVVGNLITSLYLLTALSGVLFGIFSLVKAKRNLFAILGLTISLLATLVQVFVLFIVNTPSLFAF